MKQFTATSNDEGTRLSRFVQRVTTGLPAAMMYKAFRNRRVKVNGRRAAADQRLVQGDLIELYLNDEFFAPAPIFASLPIPSPAFTPVWEGAHIAVLYKPAGIACYGAKGDGPALLSSFQGYLAANGSYSPNAENAFAPALCNRLDLGTEGLVIGAKTAAGLREMNALLRDGLVEKYYLCITAGVPPAGVHHAFLRKDTATNRVEILAKAAPGTKPIATGVEVLEQKGALALCRVRLFTGRSHQIRAHLAALGAPLLGDRKYGDTKTNKQYTLPSQALCAYELDIAATLPPQSLLADMAGLGFKAAMAELPVFWAGL